MKEPDDVTKVTLRVTELGRRHLHAVFECRATNFNDSSPISATVTLDMNCEWQAGDSSSTLHVIWLTQESHLSSLPHMTLGVTSSIRFFFHLCNFLSSLIDARYSGGELGVRLSSRCSGIMVILFLCPYMRGVLHWWCVGGACCETEVVHECPFHWLGKGWAKKKNGINRSEVGRSSAWRWRKMKRGERREWLPPCQDDGWQL